MVNKIQARAIYANELFLMIPLIFMTLAIFIAYISEFPILIRILA